MKKLLKNLKNLIKWIFKKLIKFIVIKQIKMRKNEKKQKRIKMSTKFHYSKLRLKWKKLSCNKKTNIKLKKIKNQIGWKNMKKQKNKFNKKRHVMIIVKNQKKIQLK